MKALTYTTYVGLNTLKNKSNKIHGFCRKLGPSDAGLLARNNQGKKGIQKSSLIRNLEVPKLNSKLTGNFQETLLTGIIQNLQEQLFGEPNLEENAVKQFSHRNKAECAPTLNNTWRVKYAKKSLAIEILSCYGSVFIICFISSVEQLPFFQDKVF